MPYKIVDSDKLDSKLTELADKLRAKNGTTEGLDFYAGDFSEAVDSIESPKEEQEKTIEATVNGNYDVVPDEGKVLSKATVNVAVPVRYDEGYSDGYEASQNSITLQEKVTTENGEITADEGYTGLSKVDVNVPERKEEQTKALSVTENGSYSVLPDENKVLSGVEVEVDVIDNRVTEIETAIDESGVLDSTEGTVEEKVEQLVDKAEDENIWYEYSKIMTSVPSKFYTVSTEKLPKMDFSNVSSLSYAFCIMPLKRVDYYINSDACADFNSAFSVCEQLEYVKGISLAKATFVNGCFASCSALKTIEEPIDYSYFSVNGTESNTHMFGGCTALETIRIVPESIKKRFIIAHTSVLTAESIQSIIDGLAYVETTQGLLLTSSIVNNLTTEQLSQIIEKNWNIE